MNKRIFIFTALTLAGFAFAELPTSTQKPELKISTWDNFPIRLESLTGQVIEIKNGKQSFHALQADSH